MVAANGKARLGCTLLLAFIALAVVLAWSPAPALAAEGEGDGAQAHALAAESEGTAPSPATDGEGVGDLQASTPLEEGDGEQQPSEPQDGKDGEPDGEPASPEPESKRVLFLGNSFTYRAPDSVPAMLASLASANGERIISNRICENSAHLSSLAFPIAGDEARRATLIQKLQSQKWDYVVLQEQSTVCASSPMIEMYSSIRALKLLVATYQPDAKLLLYMTHGYDTETTIGGEDASVTASELELYSQGACSDIGNRLGVPVVPVGMLFYRDRIMHPWRNLLSSDDHHATSAGYFLAACAFFKGIYERAPENVAPSIASVDAATQQELFSTLEGTTSVTPVRLNLSVGEQAHLDFSTSDTVLACATLNPAVATLGADGTVTALTEGTTIAYVQSLSGMRATCIVSVEGSKLRREKLTLSSTSSTKAIGKTVNLKKRLSVSGTLQDYELVWTSSDPAVASVSEIGNVIALGAGRSVITVRDATSGASASYTLFVQYEQPDGLEAHKTTYKKKGKSVVGVKLQWDRVAGATKYKVYRMTPGSDYTLVGTSKSRTYIDKKAPANTQASYRVVAAGKYSECDSTRSDVAKGIALSSPSLTAESKAASVKLSWDRNAAADGYRVYRAAKGSSKFKLVKKIRSGSKTGWSDTTAKRGKDYRYRVRGYRVLDDTTFFSAYSSTVTCSRQAQSK